jgi:GNAT superfamily N-acetyltransferase
MELALRHLSADERSTFLTRSRKEFVDDLVESGVALEQAEAHATRSLERMFPDGIPAEGHEVFAVEDEGRVVGALWIGPPPDDAQDVLYVWDITVVETERGKGIGTATMLQAEQEARRRGCRAIALSTREGNAVARHVYGKLGYITAAPDRGAVHMRKPV